MTITDEELVDWRRNAMLILLANAQRWRPTTQHSTTDAMLRGFAHSSLSAEQRLSFYHALVDALGTLRSREATAQTRDDARERALMLLLALVVGAECESEQGAAA